MFPKELFLLLGLVGVLLLNYSLPEEVFLSKNLTRDYDVTLVPRNQESNESVNTSINARSSDTEHQVEFGGAGNGHSGNTIYTADLSVLTTANISPNYGAPGASFNVTITSGGHVWSYGTHCITISDGVTSWNTSDFVASGGSTSMTLPLNIPAGANLSSNYDIIVYDTNSGNCTGATTATCMDCFSVLADGDGDHVPDIYDNCPDDSNPGQENLDGDNYGAACDCDDDNPDDEYLVVSGSPIASGFHYGIILVNSTGQVATSMSPVYFQAPLGINLGPGFQVELGAVFKAQIGDCPD